MDMNNGTSFIPKLTGNKLLAKAFEFRDLPKSEAAKACGFFKILYNV